ncbi:MAG: MBL fold metallo-hydrolase [Ferruginibacter sp.]
MFLKIFGRKPSGKRLQLIEQSDNYKEGAFHNMAPTQMIPEGISRFKLLKDFLNKPKSTVPDKRLPSVKSDLATNLSPTPVITWFGHSSYLIQCRGKNILVDPVFSGHASPFSFMVKSFPGSDIYGVNDMPYLDMLIITHDHYDHLDYKTIKKLAAKTGHFYTTLGTGEHLERWGISSEKITELDWGQQQKVEEAIILTATTVRHFSGRSFRRDKALWAAFILKIYNRTIFIGSDSGYGNHFKMIGEKYGPFDIAILESGQYNELWPQIHMMPEETVMAAIDLKARVLFPVHWGKFALAYHLWNEPPERIVKAAAGKDLQVTTPMIGEQIILDENYPQQQWWNI